MVSVEVESPTRRQTTSVLCDTGSTHSWISSRLARGLQLKGDSINLKLSGINTSEAIKTERVEVKVIAPETGDNFIVRPFVKEELNTGNDTVNVTALKEIYPHLHLLDDVSYCYKDIEMIIGKTL